MSQTDAGMMEESHTEDTEEGNNVNRNLNDQILSQQSIKIDIDEEKIFEDAHTFHDLEKSENPESPVFQCACCARNYNESYSSPEFNHSTVLQALSTLLEFPTVATNKSSVVFTADTVNSDQDWLFCVVCGEHISALYKMFQQFRNMLQKEGQIWRTIVGGRSLRSRHPREVQVVQETFKKVTLTTQQNKGLARSNVKKGKRKKPVGISGKKKRGRPRAKVTNSVDSVKNNNSRSEGENGEDEFHFTMMGDASSEPEWERVTPNYFLYGSKKSRNYFLTDLSHSKARPRHKLVKRNKKKAAESPTFPEDSAEFNDSITNSNSKRIRNWKKESWIEKAKTDPSRTCDLCGKSFIFPAVMKRHKKIVHQGLKPYECTSCGKRFTQKVILNKHTCDFSKEAGNRDILQMNREDQLRKFICSVCGKRFKYPTHLNLHEMNHREERPYPCQQCDKTFRRPDHLKYHVRIVHVDEKKFICTKCGQTFKSISSLRAHEKKHTSDQGHLCNICGKSIKSMYQMSRHKKTHQDELPFECPVCKKRFKMKDYLGQHLRRGKTCSKKLPSFKDNTSNSNSSSVATLPQAIVVQNIPIISESDVIIRRDTVPSNSDCRNYGPVTSELVTLEFSSCFPVDDRLLTEL